MRAWTMLAAGLTAHFPLVVIFAATKVMEIEQARALLGLTFASTLATVALTLVILHIALPRPGRPSARQAWQR
ncbi:hypothetical protein [Roseovarius aquimarinus]|uniref:Uncharacterized protein n=1 Tax=Roseovarius aquimarinus TaxID=1229156 RepID=A0ABW7I6X8_9RHOB